MDHCFVFDLSKVPLSCLLFIFLIHLKLELLTQFPLEMKKNIYICENQTSWVVKFDNKDWTRILKREGAIEKK